MLDPNDFGAITTVWDWLNQVNASNFAGHNDWRLPHQLYYGSPGMTSGELYSIEVFASGQRTCIVGASCVYPIFGPTQGVVNSTSGYYWSATTYDIYAVLMDTVSVPDRIV